QEARALLRPPAATADTTVNDSRKTQATTTTPTDPRQAERDTFYAGESYQQLRQRYAVSIETTTIAGVTVEVFTPQKGIAPENQHRVLINFHGGSFQTGSRTASHSESIPIAALGNIKVISVDYRLYPEHQYPAATDDAFAVYSALLQHHRPEQIGLFGSSAGAQLITQLLARCQQHKQPLPAAIALIAEGATQHNIGDSIAMAGAIICAKTDLPLQDIIQMPYFDQADQNDPAVCPALSDKIMAAFPPTLLASSTRDLWLSPVVATHRQLLRLGVTAELHIWEGLEHCFHYHPLLPESLELHRQVVQFFQGYVVGEL
ncbi:alpha/beta hydrolase, partial [Porticoccaceae bacterium]|nr:alpha/beta hydrolase [Porticoccaceae bacterium]